jgi:hypothetical protein
MENNFALRVISPAGFSRVEVGKSKTLADLKQQVSDDNNF